MTDLSPGTRIGVRPSGLTRIGIDIGVSATDFAAHRDATTDVHGIPDTAELETQAGAQAKANAAAAASIPKSLLIAKGDIPVGSGDANNTPLRLPSATATNGDALLVDKTTPSGLRYGSVAGVGGTDAGVAGYVEDPDSQTRASLNAAYAQVDGSGNVLQNGATLSATYAGVEALAPRLRKQRRAVTGTITRMQAGHGFTTQGTSATNLNDTGDFVLGSQSASITSMGNGSTAAKITKTGLAPFNPSTNNFVMYVKVDNVAALGSVVVYIGDTGFANYKTVNLKTQNGEWLGKDGEWIALSFAPIQGLFAGTPSATAATDIQVYYTDKGSPVTLHLNGFDLAARDSGKWPNGVVSFTYDDSLLSQFTEARKALDKYGYAGTAYTIADFLGLSNTMTLSQLRQLQDINGWDISGHAYSLANHNLPNGLTDLTEADLETELRNLKSWLLDNGFQGADHFAYPKGQWNQVTEPVVSKYFASARLIAPTPTQVTPVVMPYRMRCFQVLNGVHTAADVKAQIDTAYANGVWLILCFHDIVTTPGASTQWSITDHQVVVDYCSTKGIPVRTVSDVLAAGTA